MALSKFRCRSNYLPITRSRFKLCDFEELQCILCDKFEIGNEKHYLTSCDFFEDSRNRHLGESLINMSDSQSLNSFFEVDYKTLANTANFIREILKVFSDLQ